MYVCRPTVYSYSHIGNFLGPVVVFDVLFRLLRRLYGEDAVRYAANVTDVDDKIQRQAPPRKACLSGRSPTGTQPPTAPTRRRWGALANTVQPRATGDHGRDHRDDRLVW